MARLLLNGCLAWALSMLIAPAACAAQPLIPDGAFPAVAWRLVGPFRGGWSTIAVGVPTEPDTYYFGAAGGGIWKTNDSGRTWHCVTDGQPITAIGALAVAPSDPRVLYAGTGHPEPRYDIIAGSGMYRSADAGESWQPVGLTETRHIGAVLIDARDANIVLVAALGHVFGPNPERGVFRTDDGGQHWSRTLFVDDDTGAVDLAADPSNPDIVYAATWTMRVYPWLSYFTPSEGPGSAIYRSPDGGRTWARLGGAGWPSGSLGRIGIAVTRAYGSIRLYASVTAKERGGLYRSDDDGGHWQRVNAADWVASWYESRLTVSPVDPDLVYAVGQSIHESRDAGATFSIVRGAPGGDDFHYLWINPLDPQRRVAASDQGTIVTVNGGASWSDWYNQPTGQFYYLAADDRFPYWIYSGQQDSGTVGIASRSSYGAIGLRDWNPVGGDERDYDLPDPEDPGIVYASGLGGRISRWSAATGAVENVTPWPVNSYGKRPTDFRYHYAWFTPLAVSKKKPYALYAGAQVLFRSLDRGTTWQVISPDLSGRAQEPHDCSGDLKPARALECGYGVINTIAPSPRDNAELWIGTDDGRLWLTRDGGGSWRAVTPPGVPAWGQVSSIDPSEKVPGLTYVAIDNHRQDDFRPYVYVTHDDGASWTSLSSDLPAEHFVSVVRQDPVRPGLLFAGTDAGVSVSFDDGAHWQGLKRHLPPVWVHDLLVKDRDLIAATVGRGIWVLDDLSPLRQVTSNITGAARLYAPSPAYRLRPNENKDTPFTPETPLGRNPPTGAVIDYWIAREAQAPVELEVRDAAGALVQRFSSADRDDPLASRRYFSEDWLVRSPRLSGAAGAHRFLWNLRLPRPPAVEYTYSIAASRSEGTELLPQGPLVLPGDYRLTLIVDGARFDVPLLVKPDPRTKVSQDDLAAGLAFSHALASDLERAWRGYAEVSAVLTELAARQAAVGKDPAGTPLAARLVALALALESFTDADGRDPLSFAAASDTLAAIATDVESADRVPTVAQREAARVTAGELAATGRRWAALKESELPAVSRLLQGRKLPPLAVPDAAHLEAAPPPASHDLP